MAHLGEEEQRYYAVALYDANVFLESPACKTRVHALELLREVSAKMLDARIEDIREVTRERNWNPARIPLASFDGGSPGIVWNPTRRVEGVATLGRSNGVVLR